MNKTHIIHFKSGDFLAASPSIRFPNETDEQIVERHQYVIDHLQRLHPNLDLTVTHVTTEQG